MALKEIRLHSHNDVDRWAQGLLRMGEDAATVEQFRLAAHTAIETNPHGLPLVLELEVNEPSQQVEEVSQCARCGKRFEPRSKVILRKGLGVFHPRCAPPDPIFERPDPR